MTGIYLNLKFKWMTKFQGEKEYPTYNKKEEG